MGCEHCTKKNPGLDQHEMENSSENNNPNPTNSKIIVNEDNKSTITKDTISINESRFSIPMLPKDKYSENIFNIINNIRTKPKEYAQIIKLSMKNITTSKERLIYKNKVKVALTKGKDAFEEAIYILEKMEPLSPLMFNNAIMIPHPTNEAQAKDTCYFRQQIRMIEKHTPLAVHFKEYIKEPGVSALLMIVDDVNKNPGKKRTALLNPNYKYIGISSVNFDKTFVAFFTFSL